MFKMRFYMEIFKKKFIGINYQDMKILAVLGMCVNWEKYCMDSNKHQGYSKLSTRLHELGFVSSKADTCLSLIDMDLSSTC